MTRLVSGPTNAIRASSRGRRGKSSICETPPISSNVIALTRLPVRRAYSECASSCRSTAFIRRMWLCDQAPKSIAPRALPLGSTHARGGPHRGGCGGCPSGCSKGPRRRRLPQGGPSPGLPPAQRARTRLLDRPSGSVEPALPPALRPQAPGPGRPLGALQRPLEQRHEARGRGHPRILLPAGRGVSGEGAAPEPSALRLGGGGKLPDLARPQSRGPDPVPAGSLEPIRRSPRAGGQGLARDATGAAPRSADGKGRADEG